MSLGWTCPLAQLYGLTPGPATGTGSSCHRFGLGLPILAPVINNHQQAQSDTDVDYDNCDHGHQIHLHAVLTHCRGQEGQGEEDN